MISVEKMEPSVNTIATCTDSIVSVEKIHPAQAEKWLETSPGNRVIHQREVNSLIADIERGNWQPTVGPIHLDAHGRLRNGHHRCWAISLSGKTVENIVVRNASEAEIDAVDNGAKRTPGDTLAFAGYDNSKRLAESLSCLWRWENGYQPGDNPGAVARGLDKLGFSNEVARTYAPLHPKMQESVQYVIDNPMLKRLGAPALLAFCHYVICQANPQQGAEFFHCVVNMIYLQGTKDPVYHLRHRLESSKTTRKFRLARTELCALVIKAYNKWLKGEPVQALGWSSRPTAPLVSNHPSYSGLVRRGERFPQPLNR
jgi:hypothetical protein